MNFSELARKYGIAEETKNGNMVVREFLEDKEVQLSRFKQFRVNKAAARRSLKCLQGREISVPTQPTNNEIRETTMVVQGQLMQTKLIEII